MHRLLVHSGRPVAAHRLAAAAEAGKVYVALDQPGELLGYELHGWLLEKHHDCELSG